jgi:beta-fructofuranosidase
MLVTARQNFGPRFRCGCVAHATSPDGVLWTLQEPLYAPQSFEDLEVPALLKLDETYYLFFNDFGVGANPYRIADSLSGPWRAPRRELLLPHNNAVFRFCRWRGKTLVYHWLRCEADWPRRFGDRYVALMPPKEVVVEENGELALTSFSGWQEYFLGEPQELSARDFPERAGPGDPWSTRHEELTASVNGLATARSQREFDDFIAELSVRMISGHRCGIALRIDEPFEIAVWVHLDFNQGCVELHRTMYFDSALHRYKLKKPTLLQSAPAQLEYGKEVRVRVLACREYIEVSLDGVVMLSAATYKTERGRMAVWADEGTAIFSPVKVQPLSQPQ